MRSQPSPVDLEVVRRVAEQHSPPISTTQLERWRSHGLFPSVHEMRDGHLEQAVRTAVVLGENSYRLRPWTRLARHLYDEGHPLTEKALAKTAVALVDEEAAVLHNLWQKAALPDDGEEPTVGMFGEALAARLNSLRREMRQDRLQNRNRRASALLSAVRREMELAHPSLSKKMHEEYAKDALTWRIVDLVNPDELDDADRWRARHGTEVELYPIGGGVYPLPSERRHVARNLTLAEAQQYRPYAEQRIEENPALKHPDFGLLWVTIWVVTYERLKLAPRALTDPLPKEQLDLAAALHAAGTGT